jgi:osmoprotectant transport system substrate-binding protein
MTSNRLRPVARSLRVVAVLTTLVLTVAALAVGAGAGTNESLTVGSKDFAGAQALSQAYGQALNAAKFDVSFQDNIGATEVVYPALLDGDLDAYADYQGTLLTYLGGEPTGDSAATYKALLAKLKGTGIVASKPAPAVDVNGFYVTNATAKKYKLKSLSDLAKVSDKLSFGGPPECEARPLCLGDTSQDLYGFEFSEVKKLDVGGPITAQALEDGDIDVGLLFTGSSVIPKGTVLLADDKGLQPADNPVLLVRKDKATPALMKIANAVSARLTIGAYNKMSLAISEDKDDPSDAAAAFLKSAKLN